MKRAVFTALAAGACAIPRIARAQSTTIRAGSAAVESYALMYYAQEQGFFRAAGLDVNLQTFNGGGATMAALAGGALDLVCANLGVLASAHSRSIPISVIAPGGAYSTNSPTTVLAVAKASVLQAARDLNGKTVAVSTLKDLQQASVMKWVDVNGGDSGSLKFVEIPVPEMVPAMVANRVDAATLLEPSLTYSRNEIRVLGKCYDAIGKTFLISAHASNDAWLERNGPTAKKVMAALKTTAAWANKNQSAAGAILERVSKIPASTIAQMNRITYPEVLDAALFQPVIDATAQYHFLAKGFPASEMFWSQAKG